MELLWVLYRQKLHSHSVTYLDFLAPTPIIKMDSPHSLLVAILFAFYITQMFYNGLLKQRQIKIQTNYLEVYLIRTRSCVHLFEVKQIIIIYSFSEIRSQVRSLCALNIHNSYMLQCLYNHEPLCIFLLWKIILLIGGNCRMRTLFIRIVTKFRNDNNTKLYSVN